MALRGQRALTLLGRRRLGLGSQAPETWVAVGNCVSLQHEREAALRAFQRAIQLNPSYAYAFTVRTERNTV